MAPRRGNNSKFIYCICVAFDQYLARDSLSTVTGVDAICVIMNSYRNASAACPLARCNNDWITELCSSPEQFTFVRSPGRFRRSYTSVSQGFVGQIFIIDPRAPDSTFKAPEIVDEQNGLRGVY